MVKTREIYLSKGGNDNHAGTIDAPYLTLARANEEVNRGEVSKLVIREGIYALEKSFEIKDIQGLEIIPYENESVRIIGAAILEHRKIKKFKDGILQYDLKADGIVDYGKMAARGFSRPYVNVPMEVFIDQAPLSLVRYPKNDVFEITGVLDSGSIPRQGDFGNRGGKFRYADDRISKWADAEDLWVCGYFGVSYADDTIKVSEINAEEKTITLAGPHLYGINTGFGSRSFYALNMLEELSEAGEYYIGRKTGGMYFCPPEGYHENSEIAVSMLEGPMFCLMNCTNVAIRGITIEMCRGIGIYMEQGDGNRIDG